MCNSPMKHLLKSAKTRRRWVAGWLTETCKEEKREVVVFPSDGPTSRSLRPLRALCHPPTHPQRVRGHPPPCHYLQQGLSRSFPPASLLSVGGGRASCVTRGEGEDGAVLRRLRADGVDTCRRMCSESARPHCGPGPRLTALLT